MPRKPQPALLGLLLLGSCAAKETTDAAAAGSSATVQPSVAAGGTAAVGQAGHPQTAATATAGAAGQATAQGTKTQPSAAGTGAAPAVAGSGGASSTPTGGGGTVGQPTGPTAQTPTAGNNPSSGSAGAGTRDAGTPDAPASDAGSADDLCQVGIFKGQEPLRPQLSGNTGTHDPTMIEANGTFYRFWTGDKVPVAKSTDLKAWTSASPVYDSYPMWSREWLAGIQGQTFNFPWAPDISFFGGKYHLYVSFSAKFGDNISCISHLTSSDVAAGDWTDHGPVICTKGDEKYNAIDPDVGLDSEGKPYLAFGSFWDGIMAFPLDMNGDRVGTELTRLAWAKEIEAPVLFRRCGYHYLFVSHGLCCPGNNRTVNQLSYHIVVGRSKDIMGPYVDKEGKNLIDGGGTVLVKGDNTFAAAGHSDVLVTKDHIYQLYHAYQRPNGEAKLRMVELLFDEEGWPIPTAP